MRSRLERRMRLIASTARTAATIASQGPERPLDVVVALAPNPETHRAIMRLCNAQSTTASPALKLLCAATMITILIEEQH